MDICNTTPIDSIILFLQVLHILIQRAIVATEENKSVTSDTHHVEEQGIQLTLSPILLSPQDSTDCPCGENCWYMQDPFRIMSNRCDVDTCY